MVDLNDTKNKAHDKVLVLASIDETKTWQVDRRLVLGGNKLHAILDGETMFWYFKYDDGPIPGGLSHRWTTFKSALQAARNYYAKRNIKITEVQE